MPSRHTRYLVTCCSETTQGSPLSPILFLFYIADLLEKFQDPQGEVLGIGFIDDTNIVAWGATAAEACRKLSAAHAQCEAWAADNGATFAPEKYQLIHFTRSRRHTSEDLASTITIQGHKVALEKKAIKILGAWLDPRLTWNEHIAQAARKGQAASEALARLAASTWGPSARNSRLLYTAVVRPAILYGAREWSIRVAREPKREGKTHSLETIQNTCLRTITGGYQRTPRALLEREAQVPPLDIYLEGLRSTARAQSRHHQVETQIRDTCDKLWRTMRGPRSTQIRPANQREVETDQALRRIQIIKRLRQTQAQNTRHPQYRRRRLVRREPQEPTEKHLLREWILRTWKNRWDQEKQNHRSAAIAWQSHWEEDPRKLYAGLTKAESTALFLMRTEIIGLNEWLASVKVQGIPRGCPCGSPTQTVRHILIYCPRYERTDLILKCQTERLEELIGRAECAKHAARWLVQSGVMEQFRVAAQIDYGDTSGYKKLDDVRDW
jgi:hypothetical protein